MGIVNFSPKQEGTGDPSPTNVRPIYPGLTIDGIGDIYGGYVDFDTGELVEEYQLIQFDGTETITRAASGEIRRYTSFLEDKTGIQVYEGRSLAKCSHCTLVNGSTAGAYDTLRYVHSESRGYRATYVALNDAYDEQFGGSVTNVLEWFKTQDDNGTPFQLLVGRVDSVTYSLTASQLTQAYNQLAPTSPAMLNKRRRMLLNTPHLETASGSIVTFDTDMRSKLKECKINFLPVQSGSGDPSPTNIRLISGRTGISINNGDTIQVSWQSEAGTLYGGYVDLISGEVWKTLGFRHFTENDKWSRTSSSITTAPHRYYVANVDKANGIYRPIISDKLGSDTNWQPHLYKGNLNNGGHFIWGAPPELSTVEIMKEWLQSIGGFDVVYELTTPVLIASITPQQIKTLIGRNNIWSDAGNVEVKYWTH